jgi:hypothetical protein
MSLLVFTLVYRREPAKVAIFLYEGSDFALVGVLH